MSLRLLLALLYCALEVFLVGWVGVGWAVLLGYIFAITLLMIPMRQQWVDSAFTRWLVGRIDTPEKRAFFGVGARSRGYLIAVAVTALLLLGIALLMLLKFNVRVAEVFQ